MAQDDQQQKSGSIKSSKKIRQKKVPQRGLGVAQLEKIRLEDHQKKNAVLPSDMQSVLQNNNPLLVPNFRLNNHPGFDSDSGFRADPCSDSTNKQLNFGSWGKLWKGEQIPEGGSNRFDQSGRFNFRPKTDLSYESMPNLPAPSGLSRKELFQPQNSSSSMVKVSSGTSSSSVITYNQMEPPSNQSFNSKFFSSRSKWPEEDKMTGIKRSYPFSFDNLSGLAYPRKSPPVDVQHPFSRSVDSPSCAIGGLAYPCKSPPVDVRHPFSRSVDSPSCAIGGLVRVQPQKPLLREGTARSLSVMPEMRTGKVTGKVGDLSGDFLTLALPKPPPPRPTRDLLNIQENANRPSLYNFFPSSNTLNGQETNNITSSSGEVEEEVDLDLKL